VNVLKFILVQKVVFFNIKVHFFIHSFTSCSNSCNLYQRIPDTFRSYYVFQLLLWKRSWETFTGLTENLQHLKIYVFSNNTW